MSTIQDVVADALQNQARWREMMFEEWRDDRNIRAARALYNAADEASTLTDDDPFVLALAAIDERNPIFMDGTIRFGEEAHEFLRTAGFHSPETPESLLAGLLEAVARDADEHEREFGSAVEA